jgi:DNA-binding MarR family transcriptional regulator
MTATAESIPDLLRRAARAIERLTAERMRDLDVTPLQAMILVFLANNPGLTATAISQRLDIDMSTMADQVKKLRRAKLIESKPQMGDGRAKSISLTKASQSHVEGYETVFHDINRLASKAIEGRHSFIERLQMLAELR